MCTSPNAHTTLQPAQTRTLLDIDPSRNFSVTNLRTAWITWVEHHTTTYDQR